MGQAQGLVVDVSVIRTTAQRFDAVAQVVARVARLPLGFDAAAAGRAHAADGASVRRTLDGLATDLASWTRAAAEISSELRCSADRYISFESDVAAGLG